MTSRIEAFKKEHPPTHKKEYWQNELESLGIESKRQSELNDDDELEALAENIKQVYYQDYKAAYEDESGSKSYRATSPFRYTEGDKFNNTNEKKSDKR